MFKVYNQCKKLIDLAVKINLKQRNSHKKEGLGKYNFAMEYATIKVDLGRQTGKTTYILNQLNSNDDSIVVLNGRRLLDNDFKTVKDKAIVVNRYNCAKEIDIKNLAKVKTVYVDDATWNDKLELVYEFFTQDNVERTFVLLG